MMIRRKFLQLAGWAVATVVGLATGLKPSVVEDTFDSRGRIVHYTEEQLANMNRVLPLPNMNRVIPLPNSKPLPKGGLTQFYAWNKLPGQGPDPVPPKCGWIDKRIDCGIEGCNGHSG